MDLWTSRSTRPPKLSSGHSVACTSTTTCLSAVSIKKRNTTKLSSMSEAESEIQDIATKLRKLLSMYNNGCSRFRRYRSDPPQACKDACLDVSISLCCQSLQSTCFHVSQRLTLCWIVVEDVETRFPEDPSMDHSIKECFGDRVSTPSETFKYQANRGGDGNMCHASSGRMDVRTSLSTRPSKLLISTWYDRCALSPAPPRRALSLLFR